MLVLHGDLRVWSQGSSGEESISERVSVGDEEDKGAAKLRVRAIVVDDIPESQSIAGNAPREKLRRKTRSKQ